MDEHVIIDLWTLFLEYIPERSRNSAANEYIEVLLENGVKEDTLLDLTGIDKYLNAAILHTISENEENDIYPVSDED